jgi:hypothetical protein
MKVLTCSIALFGLLSFLGCSDQTTPTGPAAPPGRTALATQAPADGNGNKELQTLDFDVPASCPNGTELTLHVEGWVQLRVFPQPNNSRVELDVFHVVHTWSNSAGETFVDREIGPDRYYIDRDTGHLILASTGKLSFAGVTGQIVTDLITGEVLFVTGPGFPDHLALACAALT